MRTIKGTISLEYVGTDVEFEFEVPDDATEEEISKTGWEYAADYIYCLQSGLGVGMVGK